MAYEMTLNNACTNSAQAQPQKPSIAVYAIETRGQAGKIAFLPNTPVGVLPTTAERAHQAATHRDEFTDCMEMAFAGLVIFGALLFGSGLLRYAAGLGGIGQVGLVSIDFLAAAAALGTVFAFFLGVYHFIQYRRA
jgi:hypothetical protein